ncbi:MAG TPA: hypothetical protein VMU26_03530 [Candidatus Polarisedimenticolia bacterium]|nr:hypothetical protein [Candidatus Polarisedimenticolia bacterium]
MFTLEQQVAFVEEAPEIFITVEQALKVPRGPELSQCGGVLIGCRSPWY